MIQNIRYSGEEAADRIDDLLDRLREADDLGLGVGHLAKGALDLLDPLLELFGVEALEGAAEVDQLFDLRLGELDVVAGGDLLDLVNIFVIK